MTSTIIRRIPASILGMSEPNPSYFGNDANEPKNPNWTNKNWLKSRFHFSFAEYSNPDNQNFGILRVMNDDLVQPKRGFGEHPHRDAEICTYVVDGYLSHEDSMGTKETLQRGDIQFMTAGRGVYHQEHNLHETLPLRFIQIWMTPRSRGLPPNYGSGKSTFEQRQNQWYHMVSDVSGIYDTPVKINQDANLYVSEVTPDGSSSFTLSAGRQAYFLMIEGNGHLTLTNDKKQEESELNQHDGAEIFGPCTFILTPSTTSTTTVCPSSSVHGLLVEMAATGPGRRDL